jgi:hypothetical protein
MTFKRDSIGRSDVYNNPYDTRYNTNPAIKKFRAEGSSDTIESQQAILERNLLRQMEEGYFKLPKGGLLFMVYLGKGLFFVMMIPAYLFFYGMPKWLLMQGAPAVLKALKKASKLLQEQFRQRVLTHIQELARKVAAQIEKFSRSLKEIFSHATEAMRRATKFRDQLKDLVSDFLRRLNQAYDLAMEPLRKGAAMAKTAKSWVSNKSDSLTEIVSAFYKKAVEVFTNPYQAVSEAIKESVKKFRNSAEQIRKTIGNALDKALLNPLRQVGNKVAEITKKITQPIVDLYKKRVLDPYRKISERIKKTLDSVVEVLRERQEKVRELALNIAHKTKDLFHKVSENINSAVVAIANGIVNMIPQPVINFFVPIAMVVGAVWRAPSHIRKGGRKLIQRMKNMKEWAQATSKWVIVKVIKAGKELAKAINWIAEQLQKVPSKIWKLICAAVAFSIEATKRVFFLLRLLFTWIKVLFKYGLFEVRKFVSQIPT